jgi:hypothetical protein
MCRFATAPFDFNCASRRFAMARAYDTILAYTLTARGSLNGVAGDLAPLMAAGDFLRVGQRQTGRDQHGEKHRCK